MVLDQTNQHKSVCSRGHDTHEINSSPLFDNTLSPAVQVGKEDIVELADRGAHPAMQEHLKEEQNKGLGGAVYSIFRARSFKPTTSCITPLWAFIKIWHTGGLEGCKLLELLNLCEA